MVFNMIKSKQDLDLVLAFTIIVLNISNVSVSNKGLLINTVNTAVQFVIMFLIWKIDRVE